MPEIFRETSLVSLLAPSVMVTHPPREGGGRGELFHEPGGSQITRDKYSAASRHCLFPHASPFVPHILQRPSFPSHHLYENRKDDEKERGLSKLWLMAISAVASANEEGW